MKVYKMTCGINCVAETVSARNAQSALNKCLKWAKKGDWSECEPGEKIDYKVVNINDPSDVAKSVFEV